MDTAILSFLGGTAFKLLISYSMDRWTDWQNYLISKGQLKMQDTLEANQASRHMEMLKLQKELELSVVEVEKQFDEEFQNLKDFNLAVEDVKKPTGFRIIDFANSMIRPELALFCIVIWGISLNHNNWVLTTWDRDLIAATFGVFVGTRIQRTGS